MGSGKTNCKFKPESMIYIDWIGVGFSPYTGGVRVFRQLVPAQSWRVELATV